MQQLSSGKWTKYKSMKKDKSLLSYLPETKLFTKHSLWSLMDKFEQVMIKPCGGSFGRGIIQLSYLDNDRYHIHDNCNKFIINGREKTYDYLMSNHIKGRYIVQQRIALAVINDSPFDIRVMVQRTDTLSTWEVTGKLAKVAASGFVITNAAKEILPVEEAIRNSKLDELIQIELLLSEIDRVSIMAVIQLEKLFPQICRVGLDIGLDESGRTWIIEANFRPVIFF